jgi:predicted DNA-binding protein
VSPSKRPQTPIRIPPAIRERLDAEVSRTGLSINAIVTLALDKYLPAAESKAEPGASGTKDDGALDWE